MNKINNQVITSFILRPGQPVSLYERPEPPEQAAQGARQWTCYLQGENHGKNTQAVL